MTHDKLLAKLSGPLPITMTIVGQNKITDALRAVVELHTSKSFGDDSLLKDYCSACHKPYPCATIQAIEKELG